MSVFSPYPRSLPNLRQFLNQSRRTQLSRCHLSSTQGSMDLKALLSDFEKWAPSNLAEKWDNVGLLIEPSGSKMVRNVLLTNDLTEDVMTEALETKADLIFSYHPPIFAPLKRITGRAWKERIVQQCLENRIALYSPHTAFDALEGGVADWLLQPIDIRNGSSVNIVNKLLQNHFRHFPFTTPPIFLFAPTYPILRGRTKNGPEPFET